ncbi:MAG: hypothetical protein KBS74_05295 [Clostridiales bacterium]|nr:hypothetical protein [Candidatus Cacconaster stercorequi]
MKRYLRKTMLLLMLTIAVCLLGGCQFTASVEDLLTLPQMPLEYTGLSKEIDSLIAGGYEYTSPTSGQNIQSVQMVDLNNDGDEEAVAFFRRSEDEKPLKIVVFWPEEDTYRRICTIESSGTDIERVSYQDLTGDGTKELIVGWKIGTDVQTVAVYEIAAKPVTLMRSGYTRFTVQVMDAASSTEPANLVVLRSTVEGKSVAELYQWKDNSLSVSSTCALSSTMAELNRGSITAGNIDDRTRGLYVTGVNDRNQAVTDILVCKDGALTNVVANSRTGLSSVTYPYCQIMPQDINGDGVVETPDSRQGTERKTNDGIISWRRYDSDGQAFWVEDTYHCLSDGWYFTLDNDWHNRITATAKDNAAESRVTWYVDGEAVAVLYTISGDNRENRATQGNRFILRRQTAVIFAGELLAGGEELGLDENFLRENFNLIMGTWASADN